MSTRSNHAAFRLLALALPLVLMLFSGCDEDSRTTPPTRASIQGTVLDRATGAVVAGARIDFPDGRTATSSDTGRFDVGDFDLGLAGELRVRAEDGRAATLAIRPLRPGDLEVVLHVGR